MSFEERTMSLILQSRYLSIMLWVDVPTFAHLPMILGEDKKDLVLVMELLGLTV